MLQVMISAKMQVLWKTVLLMIEILQLLTQPLVQLHLSLHSTNIHLTRLIMTLIWKANIYLSHNYHLRMNHLEQFYVCY